MGAKFKKASTIILASIATMLAGLCIFLIGQSLWPQSGPAISDERQADAAQPTRPTESVLVRHHDEEAPQAASPSVTYDVTQGSDYTALYRGVPDNSLIVCAKREDPRYPSDFQSQFDHGKIVVPKGAVFLWGGHYFGPPEDPRDDKNLAENSHPLSWSGTDAAEQARRNNMIDMDMSVAAPGAAVVTTVPLTLTEERLCGSVAARTLLSKDWKFRQATVTQADAVYYQLYGILRGNKLDTSFDHDTIPIKWAGSAGSLNAVIKGTIENPLSLPSDAESRSAIDAQATNLLASGLSSKSACKDLLGFIDAHQAKTTEERHGNLVFLISVSVEAGIDPEAIRQNAPDLFAETIAQCHATPESLINDASRRAASKLGLAFLANP
ncbi:hypothetical protein C0V97_03770 [Asaia sp. W19]|nr:hypothetical protein C0V97_03770 [Asaia sp. W19]